MGLGLLKLRDCFDHTDNKYSFQYAVNVTFRISAFQNYIKVTESLIEKEKQEFKELAILFESGVGDYVDMEEYFVKKNIPTLYYSSIFISIYSFLEQTMSDLCQIAEHKQSEIDPTCKKIGDFKGKGVFLFKRYMESALKIDFTNTKDEWNMINNFNKLRNVLVHEPDHSSTDEEKIRSIKAIENIGFRVTANKTEFFIKDSAILFDFLKVIDSFLGAICLVKIK